MGVGWWIGWAIGLILAIGIALAVVIGFDLSSPWNLVVGFFSGFIFSQVGALIGQEIWD